MGRGREGRGSVSRGSIGFHSFQYGTRLRTRKRVPDDLSRDQKKAQK